MKWIRTTERLPTEADADWDGEVCFYSEEGATMTRFPVLHAELISRELGSDDRLWWLEGYRTEKPEPPKEDDE